MRITVDRQRCTGHGRCYTLVPELFAPDDDGYGEVIGSARPAEFDQRARVAEMNCPEDAISIGGPGENEDEQGTTS